MEPEVEQDLREGLREVGLRRPAMGPIEVGEVIGRAGLGAGGADREWWRRPWLVGGSVAAVLVVTLAVGLTWWLWPRESPLSAVPAAPSPSTPSGQALLGTWRAVSIGGVGVIEATDGFPEVSFFEDGVLGGADPCNGIGGSWEVDGDRLRLSHTATEMACGNQEVVNQQSRFADALSAVRRIDLTGERLVFLDGGDEVLAEFELDNEADASVTPSPTPVEEEVPTATGLPMPTAEAVAVEIRVRNSTGRDFESLKVWVGNREVELGPLASGEVTDLLAASGPVYSYTRVTARTTGGTELSLMPADYVGETPLSAGRYTWVLSIQDDQLAIDTIGAR